jgi:hypothetical protein
MHFWFGLNRQFVVGTETKCITPGFYLRAASTSSLRFILGGHVKRIFLRWISATALTIIAAVVLSGIALAQYAPYDDDNYYERGSARQAHQYGYQSGYRDGYGKGRHEGRENDPGDINIRALQDATHGYQRWMGPIRYFQDGYRDGYSRGFRSGYDAVNGRWEDRDDDDDEY